jgi:hypothetical protein
MGRVGKEADKVKRWLKGERTILEWLEDALFYSIYWPVHILSVLVNIVWSAIASAWENAR